MMELDAIIKSASEVFGLAVATSSKVFGNRFDWLPLEKSARKLAYRITLALTAALLVLLWLLSDSMQPFTIGITAVALLVLAAAVYVVLRGVLARVTFFQTAASGENIIVLGGFQLTPEAREVKRTGVSQQDIFAGSLFKREMVWSRQSLARTEMLVTALLILLFALGSTGFAAIGIAVGAANQEEAARALTVQRLTPPGLHQSGTEARSAG